MVWPLQHVPDLERLANIIYAPRKVKEEEKGIFQIPHLPLSVFWRPEAQLERTQLDVT